MDDISNNLEDGYMSELATSSSMRRQRMKEKLSFRSDFSLNLRDKVPDFEQQNNIRIGKCHADHKLWEITFYWR
jgi:hypothetical protein